MMIASGIVVLLGVAMMAVGVALYATVSGDLWEASAYGMAEDYVEIGKESDLYWIISEVGIMMAGIGVAMLAFGLAVAETRPMTYRMVDTRIPLPPNPP